MAKNLLLLTSPLFLLAVWPSEAQPVHNGSFEELAASWDLPADAEPMVRVVDDDGFTGHSALHFEVEEPTTVPPVRQEISVEPNTEYVLTAAFKAEGLQPVVGLILPGEREEGVASVRARAEQTPWHSQQVRFNSGANERFIILVSAHPTEPAPAGRAWVDDVQVIPAAEFQATQPVPGGYVGPPPGPNLARDRPYTLSQEPNYGYCTDENDEIQLTDGTYSVGYFWVQPSTVGWNRVSPVEITVDLGQTQPIVGVSFSTAAGTAGVGFPSAILILVSDDDETYYEAGELISQSAPHGLPDAGRYGVHRYVTTDLKTHGRWVRFVVVPGGMFCFCDEVEVYGGSPDLLQADRGEPVMDVAERLAGLTTLIAVRTRLNKDLQTILARAAEANLPAEQMARLTEEAAALRAEIAEVDVPDPQTFRAIVPFNDLHRRILRLHSTLLQEKTRRGGVFWQNNRWDMLDPLVQPPEGPPLELRLEVMTNEYRAETFNLTNTTPGTLTGRLRFVDLPGSPRPDYLVPYEVQFAESREKVILAAALTPAPWLDNGYQITIPAGMTRQVWLSCHVTDLPPGDYTGAVVLDGTGAAIHRLPLTLHVSPLRFPDRPTCSLGVWDYTDGEEAYGLKPGNRDQAIANMKAHFVDSPWAHSDTADEAQVDAAGHLLQPPDFTRFDAWVEDWAGARNYMIFLNVGDTFAGKQRDSDDFRQAVGEWAQAWAEHNREIGLQPRQVAVLLVDEPSSKDADERIIAWAKAIRAGTDEIVIWEDPCHVNPQEAVPELWEVCDVLCPNIGFYHEGGPTAAKFYEELRQAGKTLWFYVCSGGKLGDPYNYYRLQMWYGWKIGATGSGYWAFGDTGGADSEWNGYAAPSSSYSPVYIDATSVTDAKHWEAVREGIEDYEYLVMLRDRLAELRQAGLESPQIEAAEQLLREAPQRVVPSYSPGDMAWKTPKDRSVADQVRVEILRTLETLAGMGEG